LSKWRRHLLAAWLLADGRQRLAWREGARSSARVRRKSGIAAAWRSKRKKHHKSVKIAHAIRHGMPSTMRRGAYQTSMAKKSISSKRNISATMAAQRATARISTASAGMAKTARRGSWRHRMALGSGAWRRMRTSAAKA